MALGNIYENFFVEIWDGEQRQTVMNHLADDHLQI